MERIFQIYQINLDEINLEINKYNRLKTELYFFYNHSRSQCKTKNSYLYLIDDTYLEKVYKHILVKFIPNTIHNSIRMNHNTFSFYKYETIFYMYIQKDKYKNMKIKITLDFFESYPFCQPIAKINDIPYRDVILFRKYFKICDFLIDSKYPIYTKCLNYGFNYCECCESLFFKKDHNPTTNLSNYLSEIKKVLFLKINAPKIIMARIIMKKYLGIEFEIVYQYLIGNI